MFGIKRILDDADGTHMESYLTDKGEYGLRSEAYAYLDYNEASEDCRTEDLYYSQAFPEDLNTFKVVELK